MNLKGRLGKLERFNKSDLADHDSLMASLIGQIDGLSVSYTHLTLPTTPYV